MRRILFAAALTIPFTLTACKLETLEGRARVVSESGRPLAGAKILIGDKLNDPFENNFITANENGEFEIPQAWEDPESVTIEAANHIRTTFVKAEPNRTSYTLNSKDGASKIEIKGNNNGFGQLRKDGYVDFGLNLPALAAFKLTNFDMTDLLSPENDILRALGQELKIPSNFAVPRQSENYGILPVTLDKPIYRTFVRKPGTYTLVGLHGKFPFKEVADSLRNGGSYVDVLNKVEFLELGIADVEVNNPMMKDFDINQKAIVPSVKILNRQPTNERTQLAIMLTLHNRSFVPTDFKSVPHMRDWTMKSIAGVPQVALNILTELKKSRDGSMQTNDNLQAALETVNGPTLEPIFLKEIPAPQFDGTTVTATPPATDPVISSVGTYIVFANVVTNNNYEVRTRVWEIYALSWIGSYALPEWPETMEMAEQKRVEVNYLGSRSMNPVVQPGPEMVNSSTHVTKNAFLF